MSRCVQIGNSYGSKRSLFGGLEEQHIGAVDGVGDGGYTYISPRFDLVTPKFAAKMQSDNLRLISFYENY